MGDAAGWRALRARNEARCRRLLDKSCLLESTDLVWDRVGQVEVDDGALACLVYMRDVEGFTDRYLDGLAAHPATMSDPLIAEFLECWRAEEREHAEAIGRWLDAYGAARGEPLPPPQAPPPVTITPFERAVVAATRPVGHVVVATHMAWGATNELLTLNGYRLLAQRVDDPVLVELLARIAAQESRHYSFYVLQVEWRLAASRMARAVVRQLLRRAWTPVGVGDDFKSPEAFDAVLGYLGGGELGRRVTARMDRTISALPGLAGLDLFRGLQPSS